jgi:hypothetical protein
MKTIVRNSARFWSAPALWRFSECAGEVESGRGLPQSKTLTHNCFTQTVLVATDFLNRSGNNLLPVANRRYRRFQTRAAGNGAPTSANAKRRIF